MTIDRTPAQEFVIGSKITMLDAWMKNPTEGKVVSHPNADHVLMEDANGVRHFGHVRRVSTVKISPVSTHDFADLLG